MNEINEYLSRHRITTEGSMAQQSEDVRQVELGDFLETVMECLPNSPIQLPRPRRFRSRELPVAAKDALNVWLIEHWNYPYMTVHCRHVFAARYGITDAQVQRYLTNSRKRLLRRKRWSKNQVYVLLPGHHNGDMSPVILPGWMPDKRK